MTTFTTESMDALIDEARRISAAEDETAAERLGRKGGNGARWCNRNNYALGDRYQLQKLSITHEMVIDYLVTDRGFGNMKRCAAHFGCTRPWLSTLVHSDAFQAKLRDRLDTEYQEAVVPLREKVVGVAHRAVEKLGAALEETEDPRMILDVTDKVLHKLGYAPKTTINPPAPSEVHNTQNNYYVSPELLAAAREKAKKGDLNGENQPALAGAAGSHALPAAQELSREPEDTVGEAIAAPAVLKEEEPEEGR